MSLGGASFSHAFSSFALSLGHLIMCWLSGVLCGVVVGDLVYCLGLRRDLNTGGVPNLGFVAWILIG